MSSGLMVVVDALNAIGDAAILNAQKIAKANGIAESGASGPAGSDGYAGSNEHGIATKTDGQVGSGMPSGVEHGIAKYPGGRK